MGRRMKININHGMFAVLASLTFTAAGLAQGGAVGGAAGSGGVTGGGAGGSAAGGGSGGIGGGIAGGGIGVNGAAPGGGNLGSAGPMGGTGISSGAGNVGLAPGGGTGIHSGVIGESPGSTGNPSNSFRGAFPGAEPAPGGGPQGITGGATLPGLRGPLRGKSTLGFGQSRRGGDGRIGQGKGATPAAGDRNPAKMLLDEMNGTHEGRRSGQAAFRGRARRRMQQIEPFTPPRVAQQAVYFARRGAYEDAIYQPTNGSYRDNARRYDNRVQTAIRRGDTRASLNRRREPL